MKHLQKIASTVCMFVFLGGTVGAQTVADSLVESKAVAIPTGQRITPNAAKGAIFLDLNPGHPEAPEMRAGQAAAAAVSPDGHILAILTSGYNLHWSADAKLIPEKWGPDPDKIVPSLSTEYVFLYDISRNNSRKLQVLTIPTTFQGLAWAPSSDRIYVSGGAEDSVWEFARNGSSFAKARVFTLGHKEGMGLRATPCTGGLALSPDGTRLLVANLQNDSVSRR